MGAWAGFACGIVLLLGTGSSVVKMLLIPRNLGSLISGAISRLVLSTYRLITARIADLDEAGWVFERTPDEAWLHFRGWRVNYELAGYGIAAYLDLPKAMWSGPRRRSGREMAPARPAHREPAAGQKGSPQRDGSAARTIPLSTCANT
jgi:hypothetical protein